MQVCHARSEYVHWLRTARELSPHTIRAYDGDVSKFQCFLGDGALTSDIDHARVVAYLSALKAATGSPRSVRRRALGARSFCAWLHTRGLIDANPWLGVTVSAGRSRKLPKHLAAADADRLVRLLTEQVGSPGCWTVDRLATAPFEATTLLGVVLMIATGIRVSELTGIEPVDVDLAARSIRINGKGQRQRVVYLTNDWMTDLVRSYLGVRLALDVHQSQLLFNVRRQPLTAQAMRARVARAGKMARIEGELTPHMLRHTAATLLIEAGVDIRLIQRLLGHASLTTTEIYTHVSDPALRRVLSQVDILGGVRTGDN